MGRRVCGPCLARIPAELNVATVTFSLIRKHEPEFFDRNHSTCDSMPPGYSGGIQRHVTNRERTTTACTMGSKTSGPLASFSWPLSVWGYSCATVLRPTLFSLENGTVDVVAVNGLVKVGGHTERRRIGSLSTDRWVSGPCITLGRRPSRWPRRRVLHHQRRAPRGLLALTGIPERQAANTRSVPWRTRRRSCLPLA